MDEILIKIKNRHYEPKVTYPKLKRLPLDYIFDEELSVKANKIMVEEFNQRIKEQKIAYHKEYAKNKTVFAEDCINAILRESKLSVSQAQVVYEYSYRDKFINGYHEVINKLKEVTKFMEHLTEKEFGELKKQEIMC